MQVQFYRRGGIIIRVVFKYALWVYSLEQSKIKKNIKSTTIYVIIAYHKYHRYQWLQYTGLMLRNKINEE